jgi:hypothetical protein
LVLLASYAVLAIVGVYLVQARLTNRRLRVTVAEAEH